MFGNISMENFLSLWKCMLHFCMEKLMETQVFISSLSIIMWKKIAVVTFLLLTEMRNCDWYLYFMQMDIWITTLPYLQWRILIHLSHEKNLHLQISLTWMNRKVDFVMVDASIEFEVTTDWTLSLSYNQFMFMFLFHKKQNKVMC